MVAISKGRFAGLTMMFSSGTATYSAKAPSRSTPMMWTLGQMWDCPVRHW